MYWHRSLVVGLVVLMAGDFLWHAVLMPRFYRPRLEPIARLDADGWVAPLWAAAIPAYLARAAGILLFVLPLPAAGTAAGVALLGALFGAMVSGVANASNLATLRGYGWSLAIVETAWGGALGSVAAVAMWLVGGEG